MGRQPCCDKVGLKKGPWTAEEDKKLINFILTNGHCCWRAVPKLAGLLRCGKSCRLRWTNYLRPDLKRGLLSEYEEQMVIDLHAKLGNRWSKIASHLSGRTDNEIKNHWNTHIKKKLKKMGIDPQTHKPIAQSEPDPQSQSPQNKNENTKNIHETDEPKHQDIVETPGNSTITADHESIILNIEAIDSFNVDELPLIDIPNEILPPLLPNTILTTTSSTSASTSSSSSFSPSGSSSLIFEDLDIPIFDWPNDYDQSANAINNEAGTTTTTTTNTSSGLLWDYGELMNWDMGLMSDDYIEIDPFLEMN